MFKPQGLRALRPILQSRNLFSYAIPIARQHSSIRIQRVRVRERRFTWKRIITFGLYTTATYSLATIWLMALFPWIEDDEYETHGTDDIEQARRRALRKAMNRRPSLHDDEDERDEVPGEESDEEELEEEWDDEDSIFIPVTLASPCPREYYKESDPEWQAYRAFSFDKKKRKAMGTAIVNALRGNASKLPHLGHHLGKVDVNQGRVWLDLSVPRGPPLEYQRSGIEIAFLDESIAILWSTKTMSEKEAKRLKRIFMPWATISAVLASASQFGRDRWNHVKQLLGAEDKAQPAHPTSLEGQLAKLSARMQDAQKRASKANAPGHRQATPPTEPGVSEPHTKGSLDLGTSDTKRWFTGEIQTLKRTYLMKNRPEIPETPRGMVRADGWVEVLGSRGGCILDVLAAFYDPETEKIVEMYAEVKKVTPNRAARQPPKRVSD